MRAERCGSCAVLGTRALFFARASLFSRRTHHLLFSSALSPRVAARWRRRSAARARWRRACCLPCVLARPAAWPLAAACAVHGEFLLAAEVCCCCKKAHVHALPCRRRMRWGLRVCVSARVRCRRCALCVCARARSPGLWSAPRTCQHAALACVLPVNGFFLWQPDNLGILPLSLDIEDEDTCMSLRCQM